MARKNTLFTGCATAIVTPFSDGVVDYSAFGEMIEKQILGGVSAIVVLGTTGEAPCVYENERNEIISFAKRKIGERCKLIVGTGSNATSVAERYTRSAEGLGADGCLVVTPYYNKSSAKGLHEHFKSVATSTSLPIIIYNVPSRTGVNIPVEVYGEIAKIPNVVGVKEASGDLGYLEKVINQVGTELDVYTGCDELTLPTVALGGKGVISVVSNIVPRKMTELCESALEGQTAGAQKIQLYLCDLITEMFKEVNPIPIKCALSLIGLCRNELRLPLCHSTREKEIGEILKKYALL